MTNFPEILSEKIQSHWDNVLKMPVIVWKDGKAVLQEA